MFAKTMTPKQRMLVASWNQEPDMVPVAPDTSNMIPCRLTGKPFWDIYLYQDPPLWQAYIQCCKLFDFDGWLPLGVTFPEDLTDEQRERQSRRGLAIICHSEERLITRGYLRQKEGLKWDEQITLYPVADPPWRIPAETMELAEPPETWKEVEGITEQPTGADLLRAAQEMMKDAGIVGTMSHLPFIGFHEEQIMQYYDDPATVKALAEQQTEQSAQQVNKLLALRPDFHLIGASGIMTFESPQIFREISLPALQRTTEICKRRGIPSHLHACGRECALVQMAANESDLNLINPLEPPPMGDCNLAEVKQQFGQKLALMGNLHTTEVMLKGTPEQVAAASRWCIDVTAAEGGFILSTGDQCGRDTPDENINAMVETARTYGKYH